MFDKDEEIETDPDIPISQKEGYANVAGWLCYKAAPKLAKLGKRGLELETEPEPGFCKSRFIDLKNVAMNPDGTFKPGGLMYAREPVVADVEKMDQMFSW